MRIVKLKIMLLGLALTAIASPLVACGPYGDIEPSSIKFPGVANGSLLRGDYLVCSNEAERMIVVDLKRARSHDLGPSAGKRWFDADVADNLVLFINKDRLLAVRLQDGKTVHDVAVGGERVWAYGFAGKDRAFIHRGKAVTIVELTTGKTLNTIEFAKDEQWPRSSAWQKVGNRLFVAGPANTLCVIDLQAGKLTDRFAIDSRAGVSALHVEGSQVYCIGSPFGWGARIDHLTCYDMEMKKSSFFELNRLVVRNSRFASGPYGTAYLIEGNRIDRYTMAGDCCGTFTTPGKEMVLAVWHHRAIIAVKGEIRLLEINETPVARK